MQIPAKLDTKLHVRRLHHVCCKGEEQVVKVCMWGGGGGRAQTFHCVLIITTAHLGVSRGMLPPISPPLCCACDYVCGCVTLIGLVSIT